jgi:hypothetical protein
MDFGEDFRKLIDKRPLLLTLLPSLRSTTGFARFLNLPFILGKN